MRADDRPSNYDASDIVAIPVVIASLVTVNVTAVLFRLSRRQVAVSPTGFLPLAPSRRTPVAVIGAIFPSISRVPVGTVVPVVIARLLTVRISFVFIIVMVVILCHDSRSQSNCESYRQYQATFQCRASSLQISSIWNGQDRCHRPSQRNQLLTCSVTSARVRNTLGMALSLVTGGHNTLGSIFKESLGFPILAMLRRGHKCSPQQQHP